jgi:hypothetical protein
MKNSSEQIKEGWVNFTRFHCKEGFIDRWMGDCFSDPNNDKPSIWNGNMFTQYYRVNGGKWINRDEFDRNFIAILFSNAKNFTAEEIWNESLIK